MYEKVWLATLKLKLNVPFFATNWLRCRWSYANILAYWVDIADVEDLTDFEERRVLSERQRPGRH